MYLISLRMKIKVIKLIINTRSHLASKIDQNDISLLLESMLRDKSDMSLNNITLNIMKRSYK